MCFFFLGILTPDAPPSKLKKNKKCLALLCKPLLSVIWFTWEAMAKWAACRSCGHALDDEGSNPLLHTGVFSNLRVAQDDPHVVLKTVHSRETVQVKFKAEFVPAVS